MTFLEAINAVLLRLREDAAGTIDESTYVELIGAFVNEAKQDVEDSWNWSNLRTYIDVTTSNGDDTYNLTGSNVRTRILDCYNVTKKWPLSQLGQNQYTNRMNNYTTVSSSPYYFDVTGVDYASTEELIIRVYPTPTGTETLRFYVVLPQDDLTAASDVIQVHGNLVVQGAYLKAINERGEDQGNLSATQASLYNHFLGTAIAQDAANFSDETTWHPI